jgi:hypothetical protein
LVLELDDDGLDHVPLSAGRTQKHGCSKADGKGMQTTQKSYKKKSPTPSSSEGTYTK